MSQRAPNWLGRFSPHIGSRDGELNDASEGRWRFGVVEQPDPVNGLVKVRFQDFDQIISYWLFIIVPKTKYDKYFWCPDMGDQVLALMDAYDEYGAVIGACYSGADETPMSIAGAPMTVDMTHVTFKDGTQVEYDRNAHIFKVKFKDNTLMKYDAAAHLWEQDFEDGTTMKYDAAAHVEQQTFRDGAVFKYDADQSTYLASLPTGASWTVQLNNSTIQVAIDGTISILAPNGDILFRTNTYDTTLNQIIAFINDHLHSDAGGTGDSGPPVGSIP